MSDSGWWAKKLGGGQPAPQQHSTPPVPAAVPPGQRPMAQVPQQYAPQGQVVQQPEQEGVQPGSLSEGLQTKTYSATPQQAKALLRTGGQCPDCGSGNYFTGTANGGGAHCYDCGYPIVQAGSGSGALGGSGIIASGGTFQAESPQYVDPKTLG